MRAKKMSEWDRERYTNTSFDSAQMCQPRSERVSQHRLAAVTFKALLNPIMKLVTLPQTHSVLTGECPHAGPTNTNYVWGFLTLSEHVWNAIVGPAVCSEGIHGCTVPWVQRSSFSRQSDASRFRIVGQRVSDEEKLGTIIKQMAVLCCGLKRWPHEKTLNEREVLLWYSLNKISLFF